MKGGNAAAGWRAESRIPSSVRNLGVDDALRRRRRMCALTCMQPADVDRDASGSEGAGARPALPAVAGFAAAAAAQDASQARSRHGTSAAARVLGMLAGVAPVVPHAIIWDVRALFPLLLRRSTRAHEAPTDAGAKNVAAAPACVRALRVRAVALRRCTCGRSAANKRLGLRQTSLAHAAHPAYPCCRCCRWRLRAAGIIALLAPRSAHAIRLLAHLFRMQELEVPANEQLVYDAACALKDRHLLAQGRLFVFQVRRPRSPAAHACACMYVCIHFSVAAPQRTDSSSLRAQQRIAFFSSLFGLVHKKTLVRSARENAR